MNDNEDRDESDAEVVINKKYSKIIAIVRRYVILFKNSPVKNDDFLQVEIEKKRGKGILLLLFIIINYFIFAVNKLNHL